MMLPAAVTYFDLVTLSKIEISRQFERLVFSGAVRRHFLSVAPWALKCVSELSCFCAALPFSVIIWHQGE